MPQRSGRSIRSFKIMNTTNIPMDKDKNSPPRSGVSRDEVAQRAYQLWEAGGCPSGRDLEFWLQAEAQLQSGKQTSSPKAAVSGDGQRRESPGASASSLQAPRVVKAESPGINSVLPVNFEAARGSKAGNSKSRSGAPTANRRSASA